MSGNDKLALRWLDVVVIVLVLFSGLGAWSFADWMQKSYRSAEPPSELRYYDKHDVPRLQANLKSAEAELAATESRLFERTLESIPKVK